MDLIISFIKRHDGEFALKMNISIGVMNYVMINKDYLSSKQQRSYVSLFKIIY